MDFEIELEEALQIIDEIDVDTEKFPVCIGGITDEISDLVEEHAQKKGFKTERSPTFMGIGCVILFQDD